MAITKSIHLLLVVLLKLQLSELQELSIILSLLAEEVAVGGIKPVVVVLVGIKIVSTVRHQVVADLH
jgi:hypothetical protein